MLERSMALCMFFGRDKQGNWIIKELTKAPMTHLHIGEEHDFPPVITHEGPTKTHRPTGGPFSTRKGLKIMAETLMKELKSMPSLPRFDVFVPSDLLFRKMEEIRNQDSISFDLSEAGSWPDDPLDNQDWFRRYESTNLHRSRYKFGVARSAGADFVVFSMDARRLKGIPMKVVENEALKHGELTGVIPFFKELGLRTEVKNDEGER